MESVKSIKCLKRKNNLGTRIGNNNDYFLHFYGHFFVVVAQEFVVSLLQILLIEN